MPVKNFLTQEQRENLQNALKENEDSHFRQRVLMLLLMNDGKTYAEIADFLGCSYRNVAYWCCHGDPDDLESLKDKRKKGKKRKATEKYIELLMETIEKEPEEYGYEFGRWTASRLSEHLEKATGIKLSSEQVRRILKEKKYVYHWAKYSLEDKQNKNKAHRLRRGNLGVKTEQEREAFKEKLSGYIQASEKEPNKIQVWFWDESGFRMRVIRRKSWRRIGKKKKITGQRRKGRVNVMGGLRYSDQKRICYFIEKGESETFYNQITSLNEAVKNEWVNQGNQESDFADYGPRVIVILDNASFHKKKEIIEKIESEMPNIILEYLPEYSPDYNLIELVWHSTKEYVAHRLFKSVQELETTLDKLLNQGGLQIKWKRKIKNKGNAVIAS